MLFIFLLIYILVVECIFTGGNMRWKKALPWPCVYLFLGGGVLPLNMGNTHFSAAVAPWVDPQGEGDAAQKDSHRACLFHHMLALAESRELSSPLLAAFLPLTCPNTPAWVFKHLEGKLAVYVGLSGKVCPQADIRLLTLQVAAYREACALPWSWDKMRQGGCE